MATQSADAALSKEGRHGRARQTTSRVSGAGVCGIPVEDLGSAEVGGRRGGWWTDGRTMGVIGAELDGTYRVRVTPKLGISLRRKAKVGQMKHWSRE